MSGLLVLGLTGSIYLAITLVIHPRHVHFLLTRVCWFILAASGQFLRIEGRWPSAKEGPFIYIFNHASLFDVLVMVATVPEYACAVGKSQQFDWPFWGWIIKRYGAIPIRREKLQPAIKSLNLAEESIRSKQSLVISPEGTRTLNGELLP